MPVRPARPADVPEILAMVRELAAYERAEHQVEATGEQLQAALFGPHPALFGLVAEPTGDGEGLGSVAAGGDGDAGRDGDARSAGRGLAGFALWFLNYSTWLGRHGVYLEDLYVRPAARGQGHGRALIAELARVCVQRGYGRLEWQVLDWLAPAQEFYGSLGAVPMQEWTVHRLTGEPLRRLGASDDGAAPWPGAARGATTRDPAPGSSDLVERR